MSEFSTRQVVRLLAVEAVLLSPGVGIAVALSPSQTLYWVLGYVWLPFAVLAGLILIGAMLVP